MQETSRIAEIGEDVFALSDLVDTSLGLSWLPEGIRGYDPSTVYVVRSASEAAVIDTGLRVFERSLVKKLKDVIHPGSRVTVIFTRVEPDCVGNAKPIADSFDVVRVYSVGSFHSLALSYPEGGRYVPEAPGSEVHERLKSGVDIRIGETDRLVTVTPSVRTLTTQWVYDRSARILFPSDFFGYIQVDARWTPINQASQQDVLRYVTAKFDWLKGANTSLLVERLDKLFGSVEIDSIAPAHGLWITGKAEVQRSYDLTRHALEVAGSLRGD